VRGFPQKFIDIYMSLKINNLSNFKHFFVRNYKQYLSSQDRQIPVVGMLFTTCGYPCIKLPISLVQPLRTDCKIPLHPLEFALIFSSRGLNHPPVALKQSNRRYHEENFSTQCIETQAHSRIPRTHGEQKRPPADQPTPRERPQAFDSLIATVRSN
jgi:hypothetical protein